MIVGRSTGNEILGGNKGHLSPFSSGVCIDVCHAWMEMLHGSYTAGEYTAHYQVKAL